VPSLAFDAASPPGQIANTLNPACGDIALQGPGDRFTEVFAPAGALFTSSLVQPVDLEV
jgi:hypothetical protein